MPLRTRDFESRASAIPPLRHLGTSTASPREECSKRRRGGLNAAAGGGRPSPYTNVANEEWEMVRITGALVD